VVGILQPTGTSQDRAIFTRVDSVWVVHDAEKALHDRLFGSAQSAAPEPEAPAEGVAAAPEETTELEAAWVFAPPSTEATPRELTSILVQLRSSGLRYQFAEEYTEKTNTLVAIPIREVQRLYTNFLQPMERTLLLVAYVVVVVAALSILTGLYQAGERRRRDVAILRVLGARPREVMAIVLGEAALLSVLGTAAGWLLAQGGLVVFQDWVAAQTGFAVRAFGWNAGELLALLIVVGCGLLAGILPAWKAQGASPLQDLQS
jgi:putative ABC transport system permease protein